MGRGVLSTAWFHYPARAIKALLDAGATVRPSDGDGAGGLLHAYIGRVSLECPRYAIDAATFDLLLDVCDLDATLLRFHPWFTTEQPFTVLERLLVACNWQFARVLLAAGAQAYRLSTYAVETVLHESNSGDMFEQVLASGAKIPIGKSSVLFAAMRSGNNRNAEKLRLCLTEGASACVAFNSLDYARGCSLLDEASKCHITCVEALLLTGCDSSGVERIDTLESFRMVYKSWAADGHKLTNGLHANAWVRRYAAVQS